LPADPGVTDLRDSAQTRQIDYSVIGISIRADFLGCLALSIAILEILQKSTAIFAVLVGGIWVLMNYVRNRTHVPRLQVEAKAELVVREDRNYSLAGVRDP
jgi:hypothetical protein